MTIEYLSPSEPPELELTALSEFVASTVKETQRDELPAEERGSDNLETWESRQEQGIDDARANLKSAYREATDNVPSVRPQQSPAAQALAKPLLPNGKKNRAPQHEKRPKFSVRSARFEDIDGIIEVDMRSFDSVYESYPGGPEKVRAELKEKFIGRFNKVGGEWITVLERDGAIVGCMMSCPTNKTPEDFESWEKTTDNGTLEETYDPNGKQMYVVSLASTPEGSEGTDMLYAHQMAKALREGYKTSFFESRMPGFRSWATRQAQMANLNINDVPATELDGYAEAYFTKTTVKKGKEVPLDPLLRYYARIGCNLQRVVANAYQDGPSMNYGVVCTYDFQNLFDGSVLPFKVPRNRTTEWLYGVALGAASHYPKVVKKLFA